MKPILLSIHLLLLPVMAVCQCFEDRHNTSWNEGWYSCETRANPNPQRGAGHWIMFDMAHTYRLGNIHMWNINTPDILDNGFKNFFIDYSVNGRDWIELGQYNLGQAPGKSIYEGEDIGSFSGDTARFVLFSSIENWGGGCAGFAEVKMDVIELVSPLHAYQEHECFEVSVFPNPHRSQFTLSIETRCKGSIDYELFDSMGRKVLNGRFASDDPLKTREFNTTGMAPGLYHIILRQNDEVARYPVMKLQ